MYRCQYSVLYHPRNIPKQLLANPPTTEPRGQWSNSQCRTAPASCKHGRQSWLVRGPRAETMGKWWVNWEFRYDLWLWSANLGRNRNFWWESRSTSPFLLPKLPKQKKNKCSTLHHIIYHILYMCIYIYVCACVCEFILCFFFFGMPINHTKVSPISLFFPCSNPPIVLAILKIHVLLPFYPLVICYIAIENGPL